MDGQTESKNASMGQYLRVFINQQQDDWVQWLPLAEFAANNVISETTKCTAFFACQVMDPQMPLAGEPTKKHHYRRVNADQVQVTVQYIHEHHPVEIR